MFLRPAQRLAVQQGRQKLLLELRQKNSNFAKPTILSAIKSNNTRRSPLSSYLAASRGLATAVDSTNIIYDPLASVPVIQHSVNLPQFDVTSNLLYPEEDMNNGPLTGIRRRTESNHLPSDIVDLVSVFDACLHVHKFDRAAAIIRKINIMINEGAKMPVEYLIHMHNDFLRANIEYMRKHPNLQQAEALHQWYELYIRSPGLPHTAETIAYMLRASILSAKGTRLDRLINRYMDFCPGELGLQVLSMASILSTDDLVAITQACPRYNFTEAIADEPAYLEQVESDPLARLNPSMAIKDEFPEVLATPQKGLGLKYLRENLTFFSKLPENIDVSTLDIKRRTEIQELMEKESIDSSIRRWRDETKKLRSIGLNTSLSHYGMAQYLNEWHHQLEEHYRTELKCMSERNYYTRNRTQEPDTYTPLLLQADPSRLAAVTLISLINTTAVLGIDHGASLSGICSSISRAVKEDIATQLEDKAAQEAKKNARIQRKVILTDPKTGKRKTTESPLDVEIETVPKMIQAKEPRKKWSVQMKTKVGAFLINGVLEKCKVNVTVTDPLTGKTITERQSAFNHSHSLRKGKKIGILRPNAVVISIMKQEPQGDVLAKNLPMLIPPKPWQSSNKGAYLRFRSHIVRLKGNDPDQRILTHAASDRGDLSLISRGLDVLGKTSWRINQPVLNVLMQAWNSGEAIADLPPLNPQIEIPPEPEDTTDLTGRRVWLRQIKIIENERSGLHSNRCFINFQLEIARAFRHQTFYFPHNMDFRGRAYPLPAYLNHMGADHVRGILMFGEGRPLGKNGLRWLKIHLSNVAGYDKASLDEREAFADEHIDDIRDSAKNPLGGKRWWLQSEDAWQTLAACFELKNALDCEDPTTFVSHLPVHQDGTCNGLQHYAALGGDIWGAKQVNLEPGERPADVYSAVANLVNELVDADAKNGNSFAVIVQGKITRKVVKQTVMTNVYGVTFQGAKKQVAKQLDTYWPGLEKETGLSSLILGSYIATNIFKAMGTMFRGAQEIQSWLGEVGGRICNSLTAEQVSAIAADSDSVLKTQSKTASSRSRNFNTAILDCFNTTLVWTTPLRLPVSQPYRKSTIRAVVTCLQDMHLQDPDRGDPIDRRKQLQAFPPNFIHSLDASHMLLSALRCDEKGIAFAAVHDSFWTHAADVDIMNVVLRDSFIDIHQENVIGRLAAEFQARYKGALYLARIDSKSPVGKQISAWRQNSKTTLKEELKMEELRRQLLASDDPKEVQKGKSMVTPAIILERHSSEGLVPPEGKENLAMGNIESSDASDETDPTSMSEEELEAEHEKHEQLKDALKMSVFEMKMRNKKLPNRGTAKQKNKLITVWLPLQFPDIPKKGNFDVARLRDSKYFFS